MLLFAALFTLINIPLCLFVIRDDAPAGTDSPPSKAAGQFPGGYDVPMLRFGEALRTAPFWQISLGLFACGFSMNLLGTHGVPMLMDHGFDAMTSSIGIGLIGIVAIFSTLVLGQISDRFKRKNILALIYFIRGLGFFVLVIVGTNWELFGTAAVGGIVWAGSIAMSSAILADLYGVRLVGVLYSWTYLGHQIGAMVSSWFGGWGFETFGSHWPAFGGAGALLLIAAIISLKLPVRGLRIARKIREPADAAPA